MSQGPEKRHGSRYFHRISKMDISSTLRGTCGCGRCCLANFSVETIHNFRVAYACLTERDQGTFLLQEIKEMSTDGKGSNVKWTFAGLRVCRKAYAKLTGIGSKTLTRRQHMSKEGISFCERARPDRASVVMNSMRAWINHAIETMTERLPNCAFSVFPFRSKQLLFHIMCEHNRTQPFLPDSPCLPTFYSVLKEYKDQVRFHKFKKFSKCDKCAFSNFMLAKTLLPDKRERLKRAATIHNAHQTAQVALIH
jgi:hypothetical protein